MNTVISHLPEFQRNTVRKIDKIMEGLAREIEREAKFKVPKSVGKMGAEKLGTKNTKGAVHGALQRSIMVKQVANMRYQVTAGEFPSLPYARFQEFGGDSNRRVRNYSTPGTGKGYLGDTGNRVMTKALSRFKAGL